MLFTTIYTPEYITQVRRCVKSAASRHLTIFAEAVPSLGSWTRNELLKHHHLLRMFDYFPDEDLWFVDADSEFVRNPIPEFVRAHDRTFDIGMFWQGWPEQRGRDFYRADKRGWGRWNSASVVLPASGARREIVHEAIRLATESPDDRIPQEVSLTQAILKLNVACLDLPHSLCWIVPKGGELDRSKAIIAQHQASRTMREKVNQGVK